MAEELLLFVYTAHYRHEKFIPSTSIIPINLNTIQFHGFIEFTDFFSCIDFYINFLNKKSNSVTTETLDKALIKMCKERINQSGRLIDTELYTYIDALMHILISLDSASSLNYKDVYKDFAENSFYKFKKNIYVLAI